MKFILSLLILTAGFNVFAGPEDHIQNQSCYDLENPADLQISANVPTEVCLEALLVDLSDESISVYSYFMQSLFSTLKLNKLNRHNEDYFKFKSVAFIAMDQSEPAELTISGTVDNYGQANVNYLDISVRSNNQILIYNLR
jgi:hypothetical protein